MCVFNGYYFVLFVCYVIYNLWNKTFEWMSMQLQKRDYYHKVYLTIHVIFAGPVWVYLGGYESPPVSAIYGGILLIGALAVHRYKTSLYTVCCVVFVCSLCVCVYVYVCFGCFAVVFLT